MLGVLTVFSKNIRRLRKISGLTQEKFAEKIDIQARSLIDIERGKYLPKHANIDKICINLDITVSELFKTPHNPAETDKDAIIKQINEKLNEMDTEHVKMFNNMIAHAFDKE